jgi:GDP-4-dehydro-6-deoxy-D-mannose reductase
MEKGQLGEVYNIGSGRGWKISEILDTLIKFAQVEIQTEPDQSRFRSRDVPYFVANSDKLLKLGWKPTHSIEQTLQEILNEWRTRV